ncbi:YfbM family protein [Flavitalea antarctica]
MSMVGNLLIVSSEELNLYLQDSSRFEDRIFGDQADPEDPNLIFIDKSWEGVHFLLTGAGIADESEHPLKKVLFSEQFIDENQDLGYGPANYLSSEDVIEINEQLTRISKPELQARYNPQQMMELGIYPEGWDHPDSKEFLFDHYAMVEQAFASAAKTGKAIITFLT